MRNQGGALTAIVLACVCNAMTGAMFFYARQTDSSFSLEAAIFVRILANFSCFLVPLIARKPCDFNWPKKSESPLWWWAGFGVIATWTYFISVLQVGAGPAGLLNAGSGVLVVAIAPFLTGQRFIRRHLGCALGSMIGIALFTLNRSHQSLSLFGEALGFTSGIAASLGFLIVARFERNHSPLRVIFYWSWLNLIAALGILCIGQVSWPTASLTWFALISGGLAAAASQFLTAYAYQRTHASLVACLGYLGPALSLVADVLFFNFQISIYGVIGVLMTLGFSALAALYRPGQFAGSGGQSALEPSPTA